MKAIIYKQYGPPEVLSESELERPVPAENEILIQVHATSVTAGDTRMRAFRVPAAQWLFARLYLGLFRPRQKVLGMELSGVVVATGSKVTRFKVGDEVFANSLSHSFGAYAEFKTMPESGAVGLKPRSLSHAGAAVIPLGAGTALRLLRKAGLTRGQKILVYGASGSVGTYAIQLSSYLGARVTAVCGAQNTELVKSLGAEQVIDYRSADFTLTSETYDVVFDAVGKTSRSACRSILNKNGRYVTVASVPGKASAEEIEELRWLAENGYLFPVMDTIFPLSQIHEAHRLVDGGHKRGNVAVEVIRAGYEPAHHFQNHAQKISVMEQPPANS